MLNKIVRQTVKPNFAMMNVLARGVYTKETQPHVFIN